MDAIKYVQEQMYAVGRFPTFRAGDNVSVSLKIVEGAKERIQIFRGDVIQVKGEGATKTFTVRKISGNVGVEIIYPLNSPAITVIEINKRCIDMRSKLFYLRNLVGKKAKIKERQIK